MGKLSSVLFMIILMEGYLLNNANGIIVSDVKTGVGPIIHSIK